MDFQCDEVELHSRGRLKIRRALSCKISAPSSSSFHGSCRQKENNIVRQPFIFYTVDPEIIKTEPAEFLWVVQRLTGSPDTRRLLRTRMQRLKEMQSSLQVQDVQSMQQGIHSMQQSDDDSLKEGNITPTSFINANNPIDLSKNIRSHDPTELAFFSQGNQLISEENTNHPLSPISSSSKESSQFLPCSPNSPTITAMTLPLSAKSSNKKCSDLPLSPDYGSTNHLAASPLSPRASDELSNTRGPPCSPVSPHSSLTTSSEGYHTDNLSTEGGASPYRWEALCFEQCKYTSEPEEDGSINFFDFSLDSYYGI